MPYCVTISNDYLGKTMTIRGYTEWECRAKAEEQLQKWAAQEAKAREHNRVEDLKEQAAELTREDEDRLNKLRNCLVSGLRRCATWSWNKLKRSDEYPKFTYYHSVPSYETLAERMKVPRPQPMLELLSSSLKAKRLAAEAAAREEYNRLLEAHESGREAAYQEYNRKKEAHLREVQEHNAAVEERRRAFERGDRDAIEFVLNGVLTDLDLVEDFDEEYEVGFDPKAGVAVVSVKLPHPNDVPKVVSHKYVSSRKAIEPVPMKPKEFDSLYDSLLHQIALLVLHTIFREVKHPSLKMAVVNGWVDGVDPATGNSTVSCILSVQAERSAFEAINLERVDPKECVRSLKGLVAGSLAQLAPVRPIMQLDQNDSRFVESREILADLNSTDNLATMDWADFEHLVRELFAKVFSADGAKVEVTQASRDGGVDAIAFDPDPIRGGKFVIQAKRYNRVVPVSAVRDLYGTMINEGAVKGILVTTSYFGSDSRDFVKDKPITLIDGSNLVYMFSQYGYKVRIDLT